MEIKTANFVCHICKKEFSNAYGLGSHIGWHNSGLRITNPKILTEIRTCAAPSCNNTFECKITSTKKYCHGHNRKGKKIVPREVRVCACGCKKTFECLLTSKKRYIHGHSRHIPTETRICGCGCNRTFECKTNSKQKYLPGHNNRGKKVTRKRLKPALALEVEEILSGIRLAPLCACGCGNRIKVLPHHSYAGIPKYIHGHHHKGKTYVEIYGEDRASDEFYKRLKSMQLSPNKPESLIIKFLQERLPNQYKYSGDGLDKGAIFGGHCPDFISINGQKKIIEHFGDFHHGEGRTGIPNEKHAQDKINHFAKYGYQTLIIWEHELEDVEEVIKKVWEFNYI